MSRDYNYEHIRGDVMHRRGREDIFFHRIQFTASKRCECIARAQKRRERRRNATSAEFTWLRF